jgi:hypothetical protein
LRDAIELEWAGIPSVCIVHKEMTGSAKAIARVSGHDDYEFLVVGYPHIPTAVWTDDEIRQIAKDLAPQVRDLLTKQLAAVAARA